MTLRTYYTTNFLVNCTEKVILEPKINQCAYCAKWDTFGHKGVVFLNGLWSKSYFYHRCESKGSCTFVSDNSILEIAGTHLAGHFLRSGFCTFNFWSSMNDCYVMNLRPWSFKPIIDFIGSHYRFFFYNIFLVDIIHSYHLWKFKIQKRWFLAFLRYIWWKSPLQKWLPTEGAVKSIMFLRIL